MKFMESAIKLSFSIGETYMKNMATSNITLRLLVFSLALPLVVWSQSTPPVPNKYKQFFFHYADQRSLWEKALNSIGLSSQQIGRSFALIAGVSQYSNFEPGFDYLAPVDVDIGKLKQYLKEQEFFDEIVILKNGNVNLENFNYFLENYFPKRLKEFPHSRFLFAYSGHGFTDGKDLSARGFLIQSSAANLQDQVNAIDLGLIRTMIKPVVDEAEKTLVLINACYSGVFVAKTFGGTIGLEGKGAHAITASKSNQKSFSLEGPGSVFYEKFFAALSGAADKNPADGVVDFNELFGYLRHEVIRATEGRQTPMEGELSRDASEGKFYFLNRNRQVKLGNSPPWNPKGYITMGADVESIYAQGVDAYQNKRFDEAFRLFEKVASTGHIQAMFYLGLIHAYTPGTKMKDYPKALQLFEKAAAAGNAEAMYYLGHMYDHGRGTTQDYQKARQLYEKAAAAENASAMFGLGRLYDIGLGGTKNDQKARQLYEKAAAAGNAQAMFQLGFMYEFGDMVEKDYQKARLWYEKAAAAGLYFAKSQLENLPK
jgi:TPR repeat protein